MKSLEITTQIGYPLMSTFCHTSWNNKKVWNIVAQNIPDDLGI
jgi:adenine C2-methylase RlmN of 23S rRNA A2503 and tRNA A37